MSPIDPESLQPRSKRHRANSWRMVSAGVSAGVPTWPPPRPIHHVPGKLPHPSHIYSIPTDTSSLDPNHSAPSPSEEPSHQPVSIPTEVPSTTAPLKT